MGYEAVNTTGQVDPTIVMRHMVDVTSQKGGIGIVGVYNGGEANFDVGQAFAKGIATNGAVVLPLEHATELTQLIAAGKAWPSFIVIGTIGIGEAPEYYARFARPKETKVVIEFP